VAKEKVIRSFIEGSSLLSIASEQGEIISAVEDIVRDELKDIVNLLDAHAGIYAPHALNGKMLTPAERLAIFTRPGGEAANG
jgi:hypothetical protein